MREKRFLNYQIKTKMKPELSLSGGTKSKVSLALNANKELCAECKKNVMRTT